MKDEAATRGTIQRPLGKPQPVASERYLEMWRVSNLVDYATCPGLVPGEIWTGPEIDGSTVDGAWWPMMIAELRFDMAPAVTQILAMYVLSSADGVNFADPTQNANQVWPYTPPSAGIVVIDNLEIPPMKFKLALGYPAGASTENFGPILVRTAFLAKEYVPQGA